MGDLTESQMVGVLVDRIAALEKALRDMVTRADMVLRVLIGGGIGFVITVAIIAMLLLAGRGETP